MCSSFKDIRMVDNFYQTSAFYPMPTILVSTLTAEGKTSIGSYSLCFPYYVAGKDYYAMLLECRNNSNTAQNILRNNTCALNFIEDSRKDFKEAVRLGFPGENSKDKMERCKLVLEEGQAKVDMMPRPLIVQNAYQVFECTWKDDLENAFEDKEKIGQLEGVKPPYHSFNGITSEMGSHFILKIDNILIKEAFYNTLINGTKANGFPRIPVDYGFRDNTHFWYTRFRRPISQKIPEGHQLDINAIIYAADRIDPDIKFSMEACQSLEGVPRIFLNRVLKGCVEWAKENGVSVIDENQMKMIKDKRNQEKLNK